MEEAGVPGAVGPTTRKAAWWAWPLIILSLIPLELIFDRIGPRPEPQALRETDLTDLALLKMQSQMVIGVSAFDQKAAEQARKDLGRALHGDRGLAAVALVEHFVEPGSPQATKYLEKAGSPDWMTTVREAISTGITAEQRKELKRHLGWFASLAPGPNGEAAPEADSIRERSMLVCVVMLLAVTGAIFAILSGAVLLILHLRRVGENPGVNRFVPESGPTTTGPLLEAFALYLAIMVAGSILAIWLGTSAAISAYGLSVIIPLFWPRYRGMTWSEFGRLIGWHRGRGWWREIGAGAVGYLGVLAIASIGIAVSLAISMAAGLVAPGGEGGGGGAVAEPEPHPIVGWFFVDNFWLHLGTLALAAVYAPVFEEIFFRGALFRHLRGRFRFFASALLASLIFAALHPQGVYGIPALTAIAIGFSLLREWRDSLIAPMVAHSINNGCLVILLWTLL